MLSSLYNLVNSCLRPKSTYSPLAWQSARQSLDQNSSSPESPESFSDGLLTHTALEEQGNGYFSYAIVQANGIVEDHSHVECSSRGVFIGIYDGHGGPETAKFLKENLFEKVLGSVGVAIDQDVDSASLESAFQSVESQWVAHVRDKWHRLPNLAAVGSCVLVGVQLGSKLLVANLGDSRAVLGTHKERYRLGSHKNSCLEAIQLTEEHNASDEAVREELRRSHPDDPDVVVKRQGIWRVKGIIQVSRSIGDVYLKAPEFNCEPLVPRFRLQGGLSRGVLSAQPTVVTHTITEQDKFVVFASDGLWEHLTNQEVVDFVDSHGPTGSARALLKTTLARAAHKRQMTMADVISLGPGRRRTIHDDISVVILFFDHKKALSGQDVATVTKSILDTDLTLDKVDGK